MERKFDFYLHIALIVCTAEVFRVIFIADRSTVRLLREACRRCWKFFSTLQAVDLCVGHRRFHLGMRQYRQNQQTGIQYELAVGYIYIQCFA